MVKTVSRAPPSRTAARRAEALHRKVLDDFGRVPAKRREAPQSRREYLKQFGNTNPDILQYAESPWPCRPLWARRGRGGATQPPAAVTTNDLLLESGSYILLEDGSKVLLEP